MSLSKIFQRCLRANVYEFEAVHAPINLNEIKIKNLDEVYAK